MVQINLYHPTCEYVTASVMLVQ